MVEHPSAPAAYPHIHHATRPLRAAAAERAPVIADIEQVVPTLVMLLDTLAY